MVIEIKVKLLQIPIMFFDSTRLAVKIFEMNVQN
jgi:hypothetical protein